MYHGHRPSSPWIHAPHRKKMKKRVKKRTGMNDIHGTHRTASIVENPLLLLVHVLAGNLLVQLSDDVVDNAARVVAMGSNGALREIMQMILVENVELIETSVEIGVKGREKGQEDGDEAEAAHGETAAGLFASRGLRTGGFGHYDGIVIVN